MRQVPHIRWRFIGALLAPLFWLNFSPAQALNKPEPEISLSEARLHISRGDLNKAVEILLELRRRQGDKREILEELITIMRWQGKREELLDALLAFGLVVPPTDKIDGEIIRLATDAGRVSQAVEAFQRMIARSPGDDQLRDRYLDLLLWKKLYPLAEDELRDRLARKPGPDQRRKLVRVLIERKKTGLAIAEYLLWIKQEPRNKHLLQEASRDMIALGFYKAAIAVNRGLISLAPDDPEPRRAIVRVSTWLNEPRLAMPELQWLADWAPDSAEAAMEIARCHAALSRVEDTVRWANRATEMDPHNVAYREYLAQIFIWANRPFDAITQYELLLRDDPKHYRAHFVVGDLLYWEGRQPLAQEHLRAAVAIIRALPREKAGDKETRIIFERALVRLGYFPEAVAEAESLARSFPSDREVLLRQAEIYYWAGWYEAAIHVLRGMMEKKPDDQEVKRFLAACLVRNEEHSESGPRYEEMLIGDPDDKGLLLDQAAVRMSAGRPDLAVPLFRRVLELDPVKREAALGVGYMSRLLSPELKGSWQMEHASSSLTINRYLASYRTWFQPTLTATISREWLALERDKLPYAAAIDHQSVLTTLKAEAELKPFWRVEGSFGVYEGLEKLNPAWSARLVYRPLKNNSLSLGYRRHLHWYDPETYISREGYRNRYEGELLWDANDYLNLTAWGAWDSYAFTEPKSEDYGSAADAWIQATGRLSRAPRFDVWYRFRYFAFDYEKPYAADEDNVFHDRELVHFLGAVYEYNRFDIARFQLTQTLSYDTDNDKWGSASGVYGVFTYSGQNTLEAGAVYLTSREKDYDRDWRWVVTVMLKHLF